MKKARMITVCVLLLLSLAACGGKTDGGSEQLITRAAEEAVPVQTEAPAAAQTEASAAPANLGHYAFVAEGVTLQPGDSFDPGKLPEPLSVYEVPSCAIEGTDNVYTYETFELTAFDDGSGDVIYSVLLTDPNTTTPEGLALGDTVEKMESIYGMSYEKEGDGVTYPGNGQLLCIITQGDTVVSIEYRMAR